MPSVMGIAIMPNEINDISQTAPNYLTANQAASHPSSINKNPLDCVINVNQVIQSNISTVEANNGYFNKLPNEMIKKILDYVLIPDLGSLSRVNKRLYEYIAGMEDFRSDLVECPPIEPSWKQRAFINSKLLAEFKTQLKMYNNDRMKRPSNQPYNPMLDIEEANKFTLDRMKRYCSAYRHLFEKLIHHADETYAGNWSQAIYSSVFKIPNAGTYRTAIVGTLSQNSEERRARLFLLAELSRHPHVSNEILITLFQIERYFMKKSEAPQSELEEFEINFNTHTLDPKSGIPCSDKLRIELKELVLKFTEAAAKDNPQCWKYAKLFRISEQEFESHLQNIN